MKDKEIECSEEKFQIYYGFAESQLKSETNWMPCENCDNPFCNSLELRVWYCPNQS